MVMVSNQRLKKLSHGERLYNVVESSRVSTTAPFSITTELTDPRASLAHEHSQTLALRRASSIATNTVAPTRLAHNRPPYTTGSLPARLSTPSTTLRRTKTATSRYVHKVAKVEHRVANLAKALGADYTLAEAQAIDLSPKTFNGYVPRKEGHRWCDERFETYFNQDASTKLIYGCDVGLSTIKAGGGKSGKSSESAPPASSASPPSASWLAVDRQGAALTRPVPSQSLGDKVTFRLINFKDQLAYAPIRFGQPVWMVITSGCGDDNWRSGSFLGGRPVAEVSLPITEQFVNRGSETRKNNPVQEMVREELSKREKTVSRVKEERVNPNQRVKANNEKVDTAAASNMRLPKKTSKFAPKASNLIIDAPMSPIQNTNLPSPTGKASSISAHQVGFPLPVKAAIPLNRSDYNLFIEKPSPQIQLLNRNERLGCWIVRPATKDKKTGDIVNNLDDVYFEQDFYFLSAGHVSEESEAVLRQLPHVPDYLTNATTPYAVDRRGVFRIHLADTNPSNRGLSISDKGVERLENRAKTCLTDSVAGRMGKVEYAVIDTTTGAPKPLPGGERFCREIRKQISDEVRAVDEMSLKAPNFRNENLHNFFRDKFEVVGPPDDEGTALLCPVPSVGLDGDSILEEMSYHRPGKNEGKVQMSPSASKYSYRNSLSMDDNSSIATGSLLFGGGGYQFGYEEEEEWGEAETEEERTLRILSDSVSVGGTFQKLKYEDELLDRKLGADMEKEEKERKVLEARMGSPKSRHGRPSRESFSPPNFRDDASHASRASPTRDKVVESPETTGGAEETDILSEVNLVKKELQERLVRRSSQQYIMMGAAANAAKETVGGMEEKDYDEMFGEVSSSRRSSKLREMPDFVRTKKPAVRSRTLLLPRQTNWGIGLRGELQNETQTLEQMEQDLLKPYTVDNTISSFKALDSLIASRLTASDRQTKFNELANFEKMIGDNVEVEQQVREQERIKQEGDDRRRSRYTASKSDGVEMELAKQRAMGQRATMRADSMRGAERKTMKNSGVYAKYGRKLTAGDESEEDSEGDEVAFNIGGEDVLTPMSQIRIQL